MADAVTDDSLDENIGQIVAGAAPTFSDMVSTRSGKRSSGELSKSITKKPATRSKAKSAADNQEQAMLPPPRPVASSSTDPAVADDGDISMTFDIPGHDYVHTAPFDALSARSTRQSKELEEIRDALTDIRSAIENMALSHNTLSSTVAELSSRIRVLEQEDSKRDDNQRQTSIRSAAEVLASNPGAARQAEKIAGAAAGGDGTSTGSTGEVVVTHGRPRRPRPT